MSRKAFICRDTPGGVHCSIVIVGEDTDTLVEKATEHAVESHDLVRSPELRRVLRAALKAEDEMLAQQDSEDRFYMVHSHPHPSEEDVDEEAATRDGFSTP